MKTWQINRKYMIKAQIFLPFVLLTTNLSNHV